MLFVADSAAHVRKGFAYLAAALEKLWPSSRTCSCSASAVGSRPCRTCRSCTWGKFTNDRFLAGVYSAADVFVIPSLQESFGQTVIESMACGTPVVGFDTGGIPDMVRPGVTGYLAPVGDAAALAEQIHAALHGPTWATPAGRSPWMNTRWPCRPEPTNVALPDGPEPGGNAATSAHRNRWTELCRFVNFA